jgi:hypothetical protein
VIQPLRSAEQVASGVGIDEQTLIGRRAQTAPHPNQAGHELRHRQFELADENAAGAGDLETEAVDAGSQGEGQIRHQQGLAQFRFPSEKQDPLCWQESRLDQRRHGDWLLMEQLS